MVSRDYISDISVSLTDSLCDVFQKMAEKSKRLFLVFDKSFFSGVISSGDIQRAIVANVSMQNPISSILRQNYRYATIDTDMDTIKKEMLKYRMEFMPILDGDQLVDVVFWEDLFSDSLLQCESPFDLPVVIMAGGEGRRLRPLTNVLPKPLIPIGEKTILEDIMDKFVACGSNDFYLSLNYKADFIRNYMNQLGKNTAYKLTYLQEDKPLGTAGSLKLLEKKIHSTFFVSNCDILIDEDYSQILKYHRENNNEITLVTAIKNLSIPYGVVDTTKYGLLKEIKEKPNMSFQINTGLYVLEPHLMEEIPGDTFFHITHLMDKVLKRKGRIGCFPVSEKSWKDIGDWKEYNKFVM